MSDPRDPVRQLESFDTGGVTMTPLAPSEIRRLGNRRRARRRVTTVLVAAAATAAVLVPLGIALGDGPESGTPPITRTPKPSPTAATTTAAPPAEVTYPGAGVEVKTAADTARLTGTSDAFKAFIGAEAQRAAADGASCPGAAHGITVHKYSSAGYAIGGFNACGGYAALWTLYQGTWGEGQSTQDTWDCDALAFLQVPQAFAGACADGAGGFGLPGAGGPEPGMTKAQAGAAGVRVTNDAAAPPCTSTQYAAPAVPGDTRGLFSPHDGLVQVPMTSAMKTTEKVGLGTPRSTVLAAYRNGHSVGDNLWLVPRAGGTAFLIGFGPDGRVLRFTWQLDKSDCSGYMP